MTEVKVDSKVGYLIKINNTISKVGNTLTELESVVNELNKNRSKVFDTNNDFMEWLTSPENIASLTIGQCMYIRESDSPDYWYDGVQMLIIETNLQPIKNIINENTEAINQLNNTLSQAVNDIQNIISLNNITLTQNIINLIYPVGSIMMRYDNKTPSSLPGFGFTSWSVFSSGYYLKTSTTSTVGQTGGQSTSGSTTLSIEHIPSHNHQLSLNFNYGTNLLQHNGNTNCASEGSPGGTGSQGHYVAHLDTTNTGYSSPSSHNHSINPLFIYVVVYRRTG
jgi:hypothetical protein